MLWLFKINFRGFRRFGNSSYVVLCTQCLNYNICSAWFLDIRIAINLFPFFFVMAEVKKRKKAVWQRQTTMELAMECYESRIKPKRILDIGSSLFEDFSPATSPGTYRYTLACDFHSDQTSYCTRSRLDCTSSSCTRLRPGIW